MTSTLAPAATADGNPARKAEAIRSRFRLPVALAGFVVSVVFATVGAASTPLISWMGEPADPAASPPPLAASTDGAALPPAASAAAVRSQRRWSCRGCGVVESVRRLQPIGDEPAAYEFVVRLRDGSTRTSTMANTASWRAGDRIMLIGGVQPAVL
jgi:hypothetical protein